MRNYPRAPHRIPIHCYEKSWSTRASYSQMLCTRLANGTKLQKIHKTHVATHTALHAGRPTCRSTSIIPGQLLFFFFMFHVIFRTVFYRSNKTTVQCGHYCRKRAFLRNSSLRPLSLHEILEFRCTRTLALLYTGTWGLIATSSLKVLLVTRCCG